jgi:hypothetical protein
MRRREFIAGLLLTPFATLAFAVAKRISILHSGFSQSHTGPGFARSIARARLRTWQYRGDRGARR